MNNNDKKVFDLEILPDEIENAQTCVSGYITEDMFKTLPKKNILYIGEEK